MSSGGLLERIETDYRRAFKEHRAGEVAVLRLLMAAIKNAAIAARTSASQSLDDAAVQQVVRTEVKKLRDALVDFTKAARNDLIDATKTEITTLSQYLPPSMSADELKALVGEVVTRLRDGGVSDFGKVMGAVMREVKGRADGETVTEAVKRALQENGTGTIFAK